MTGDRLNRVEQIFAEAVEASADQRDMLLQEHCGDDAELLEFVRELLRAHNSGMSGFLDSPVLASSRAMPGELPEHLPAQIGRYRILRKLGEGGMGMVYEAEQENPRRIVAIKLIKPGISSAVRRRFQYEADVLGHLRHPGIAQIYEAGVTPISWPDGGTIDQPYFAMEYIDGCSLTEFVAAESLSVPQRLALAAEICDAVQHGHQNGVIHRDIKPANILIDKAGRPKLIDFGVARCIGGDSAAPTLHTEIGQLIGTVQYMSPEQVRADPDQVDTRSDVYALGVLIFELLTGRMPYSLANLALDQATRIIRESPPTRLRTLNRALKGDIETIVLKALSKAPDRRYQSAGELRADILNYLKGEAISARQPTLAYQLRLIARRNRPVVVSAACVAASLVAGLILSTWMYVRSESARESEFRQRQIAQAVNDFLNQDLLAAVSPRNTAERDLKMRDVLDAAAMRLHGRFSDAPLVEAAIRNTLGTTYRSLGERDAAEPHLSRALELHRRELGDEHPETINSTIELGALAYFRSQPQRADNLLSRGFEQAQRIFGATDRRTLNAQNSLGFLRITQGRLDEADALLTAARQIHLGSPMRDTADAWLTLANIGVLRIAQRRHADAESVLVETIAGQRRVLDSSHPDLLLSINNLASLYNNLRRFSDAEPLLVELLDIQRTRLGEEHPDTLNTMNNLGYCYKGQGRLEDALSCYSSTLEQRRRVLGNDHDHTLISLSNLGGLLQDLRRFDEAERALDECLAARRRLYGDADRTTQDVMVLLAALYFRTNRLDRASAVLAEAIRLLEASPAQDHPEIARLLFYRGVCLSDLDRNDEAEQDWLACFRIASGFQNQAQARQAAGSLATLHAKRGNADEAATWHSLAASSQPAAP